MPWLIVNHTRLSRLTDVPIPLFALDVQRAGTPGHPGANRSACAAPTPIVRSESEALIMEAINDQSTDSQKSDARLFEPQRRLHCRNSKGGAIGISARRPVGSECFPFESGRAARS